VLLVHHVNGQLRSITDLEGQVPQDLQGERLDYYALKEISVPSAHGGVPKVRSYRNTNRLLVEYGNASKPGNEAWWYVPDQGRVLGYDKQTKRSIGSFGPDGFVRPDEQPRERFQGELAHFSRFWGFRAGPYLAFPGAVYTVNFRARTVRTLFLPAPGETVLWASRWEDEKQKVAVAFVGTDQAVHVLDEAGSPVLSAPLAYDRTSYQVTSMGRLENPQRYWVWYEPAWCLGIETLETKPAYVVFYDSAGREISPSQEVLPRPGDVRNLPPLLPLVEASSAQAWFGLVTPPAEAAVLVGTTRSLEDEVRGNNGTEVWLLLPFLYVCTQFFIPGVRWDPRAHAGLMFSYTALMLLSAAVCAVVCLLLARRAAMSRAQCIGWALCGLLWGPVGLLLLLAVQEWPARIACPACRKLRVVTRAICEHCGAPHAAPAQDGTEIFEEMAANRLPLWPAAEAASPGVPARVLSGRDQT
jgi:hypothetical protein